MAVLRINRPEVRNALDDAARASLGAHLEAADGDPTVRAVVITGTGRLAFSAGRDLHEPVQDRSSGPGQDRSASYFRFTREGICKPVICAANGTAVGGGFELLLACDLVVASEDARFGLPEVSRGLFPAGGGLRLARRIPLAVAFELAMTGNRSTPHGRTISDWSTSWCRLTASSTKPSPWPSASRRTVRWPSRR